MKIKKIISCIFFICSLVYSQNLEVLYDIKFKKDAIKSSKSNNEGANHVMSMYNQASKDICNYPMEFVVSNTGYSIDFTQSLEVDSDYLRTKVSKEITLGFLGLSKHIYNDKNISYSSSFNTIKKFNLEKLTEWKITNEKKQILGYTCYKAIFNTDVPQLKRVKMMIPQFAWFTPEISMQGGPTIFGNLPGLILELESKTGHFKATSIQKTNKKVKKIDLEGKEVTSFIENEKRYMKISENLIEN